MFSSCSFITTLPSSADEKETFKFDILQVVFSTPDKMFKKALTETEYSNYQKEVYIPYEFHKFLDENCTDQTEDKYLDFPLKIVDSYIESGDTDIAVNIIFSAFLHIGFYDELQNKLEAISDNNKNGLVIKESKY